MPKPKMLKYRLLGFPLAALLFFVLAHLYSASLRTHKNPEKTVRQFLEAFDAQQNRSAVFLKTFETEIKNNASFENTSLRKLFQEASQQSVFLFDFSKDELVLWSDNSCPLTGLEDSTLLRQPVIRLADAWYGTHSTRYQNHLLVALFKIKNEYLVENEFLRNDFIPPFPTHNYSLALKSGSIAVVNKTGLTLCYLNPEPAEKPTHAQSVLLLFLYLTAFGLIMYAVFLAFRKVLEARKKTGLLFILFPAGILLIRYILFKFKLPEDLYLSPLFGPDYYATSNLLPSLGDLFVNVFIWFLIIVFVYPLHTTTDKTIRSKTVSNILTLLSYTAITFYFLVFVYLQKGLILNSNIPLDLSDLFALNPLTWMAYLLNSILILSFILPVIRLVNFTENHLPQTRLKPFLLTLTLGILFPILILRGKQDAPTLLLLGLCLFVIQLYFSHQKRFTTLFYGTVLFILTAIPTYIITKYQAQTELNHRKLLAQKLVAERDPLTEFLIEEAYGKMKQNPVILSLLQQFHQNESIEDSLIRYIQNRYFTRNWDKFSVNITLCDPGRMLNVVIPNNQIIGCSSYFKGIIESIGKPTTSPNIHYLDYGTESTSYLAVLPFQNAGKTDTTGVTIYLDFTSKAIPRGLGYPELLVDQSAVMSPKLASYAYAIYKNGRLARNVGKYNYSLTLQYYVQNFNQQAIFNENSFNHLIYQSDAQTAIILSKSKNTLTYTLSIYSVSGILLLLMVCVLLLLEKFRGSDLIKNPDFRLRIQFAMFLLLAASFLSAGTASWFFFRRQNNLGNQNQLTEKAHSILIELQNKLAAFERITPEMSNDVYYYLNKFSLIFFTDINLYDTHGNLIASSRPQIFENGLISTRINTEAYHDLLRENRTQLVKLERIGGYEFLSAYMPLRNQQDDLLGYLNLPYFARQSEIKQEFSNFILAYINIYIILITISLFAGILITSYITSPLRLIREKIKGISLGKPNEKIKWSTHDEIGGLINEYNKMIDQLVLSAEQLARSERESAWREMAKQVAHEIKNPLTPMKLSVQHMQRAWNEKDSDFGTRLNHVSQTLITQIDTLADIATAFSDFAKMPLLKPERILVSSFIDPAIELYKNDPAINLSISYEQPDYRVIADRTQMQRVMINLLKNSIQAIEMDVAGDILIRVYKQEAFVTISVGDNGVGIPPEQQSRIFTPNFTTKSGGMGLGLAMVKTIVEDHGGHVWFESDHTKGTTFYVQLPVYEQNSVEKPI
jgi:two-component system nitrogen regulation sensor histidine kinase NtrY